MQFLITALLLLIYFVVVATLLGRWMLEPINSQGGRLQAPTQFLLTDFVWLLFQLQLALGFCVTWIGVEQKRLFPAVLSFLIFAVTLMWLFGVGFLSRAGVSQPARRAMFTLLLLPASLGVMMALPALVALIVTLEIDFSSWAEIEFILRDYQRYKALLWIITPLLPAIAWMMRQISFWIVRDLPAAEMLTGQSVAHLPQGGH
ncbi:hypothetical protein [Anatilimnocola floriformis]|uniref:hypothetical protein n=1 Tax=Anatilimnocola floriformis TaxID=2948575 RepID=UPI0020C206DB|nr:hypothetical protein [Anatilimnocola floriformis]